MAFIDRLREAAPLVAVELRPPRRDLELGASMDSWFDMNAAVRRIAQRDTVLFLTDSAVGVREEENLHHLVTNLEEEVSRARICPFLTTKHTIEYCLWYAARALDAGCEALTVLGGDRNVGPPRCVPHGYLLRQAIRAKHPSLGLGGWANPNAEPARQVGYLADPSFTADFYLTQVVSHHDIAQVEAFLEEADKRGVTVPGVFGVFYYRSARPKTLQTLARFFPVPVEAVLRDFERGLTPDQMCAETIRALRRAGARHVYVSNLETGHASERLDAVVALI